MALITSDPALCIPQAELIFIAGLPIHHNPTVLRSIKPHMDMTKKVFVGSICAYGGFNWVAAEALGPGAYSLFGTQLIPWCCGTKEYGRTGVVFGAKRLLRIATEDGTDAVRRRGHPTTLGLRGAGRLPGRSWPAAHTLEPRLAQDGVKPILAKILKMVRLCACHAPMPMPIPKPTPMPCPCAICLTLCQPCRPQFPSYPPSGLSHGHGLSGVLALAEQPLAPPAHPLRPLQGLGRYTAFPSYHPSYTASSRTGTVRR